MSKKVRWLTRCEWEQLLEARCRRVLGISLSEFRKNLLDGKYDRVRDDGSGLIELLMLVRK